MILADKIIALRRVTMEEAAAYLERGWRNAPWMGLATLLCIVSPTPLLMLAGGRPAVRGGDGFFEPAGRPAAGRGGLTPCMTPRTLF